MEGGWGGGRGRGGGEVEDDQMHAIYQQNIVEARIRKRIAFGKFFKFFFFLLRHVPLNLVFFHSFILFLMKKKYQKLK